MVRTNQNVLNQNRTMYWKKTTVTEIWVTYYILLQLVFL